MSTENRDAWAALDAAWDDLDPEERRRLLEQGAARRRAIDAAGSYRSVLAAARELADDEVVLERR